MFSAHSDLTDVRQTAAEKTLTIDAFLDLT